MTSVEENLNAMQEIIDVVDLAKLKATNLREEHLLWIQHKIANSLMYLKNGMKSGKGPYSLNDVLSDIATNLEEIANGPIRKTPIFQFLEEFEQKCRSENRDTALVQVSELRPKFTDEEIRSLTWELPTGWDHDGLSSCYMNYEWMEKNFDQLIKMQNGSITKYFFKHLKR